MLNHKNVYFILDFETTGVDPDNDYPIEVGIVITDGYFFIKKFYTSLIKVRDLYLDGNKWKEDYMGAFKVHKIEPSELEQKGKPIDVVAKEILTLAQQYTVENRKPILLSDNIQFEYRFMKNLFAEANMSKDFPFHYCGWDSSILLESTGIGDPKPVHRALQDAMLIYTSVLRALQKVDGLPVANRYSNNG